MKIDTDILKQIQGIEVRGDKTLQEHYNEFFEILREHGIYQWHLSENGNGHTGSSAEFVMCHAVFREHLESGYMWMTLGLPDRGFSVPDYMWEGKKKEKQEKTLGEVNEILKKEHPDEKY